jgi:hypothetical protein
MSDDELMVVTEMQRADDTARVVAGQQFEMTVDELVGQIDKLQDAMRRAMRDGEHYGVIPGTNKPTLLKPGAEKLCLLFRLAPTYDVTRREFDGGHIEYEVVCSLRHISTSNLIASGVGLCTTMETRYRYRKGSHACPHCAESAIIKGKEEYGGGWLCWKKKDGCGAKFPDGAFNLDDLRSVENPDLADTYNTVLKMAKKRAHVDATLTATAASDIFTQDLEDSGRQPGTTPAPFVDTGSDDPAINFWSEIKERGIDRGDAMAALKTVGGDFDSAMVSLEGK